MDPAHAGQGELESAAPGHPGRRVDLRQRRPEQARSVHAPISQRPGRDHRDPARGAARRSVAQSRAGPGLLRGTGGRFLPERSPGDGRWQVDPIRRSHVELARRQVGGRSRSTATRSRAGRSTEGRGGRIRPCSASRVHYGPRTNWASSSSSIAITPPGSAVSGSRSRPTRGRSRPDRSRPRSSGSSWSRWRSGPPSRSTSFAGTISAWRPSWPRSARRSNSSGRSYPRIGRRW